ncbi:MAG TPA: lipopolysaccharide transport periplasmic protein LptA [Rhizomicrobium sp.]|jgi:lipopolysaccharide export system protein LptA|nr:lipopolysaccharide transport periplasmic protein LptA [Rhizomicrobium sp.]
MTGWAFRIGVCLWASAALAAPASEHAGLGLGKRDANAPIEVSADRFDADFNSKQGTYSGNVLVKQGDFRLRADKVRVNVVSGKPDKIFATGNVVFTAPSGNAQGDSGVYDVGPRLITLNGHVLLTKEKNIMRGTTLTVNLATGEAQLGAKGAPGGRVQGLFTPPPQSKKTGP